MVYGVNYEDLPIESALRRVPGFIFPFWGIYIFEGLIQYFISCDMKLSKLTKATIFKHFNI